MFADTLETIWTSRHEYESRVSRLISSIRSLLSDWQDSSLPSTYPEAKNESALFTEYKKTMKRTWVGQKADCAALLSNIQAKLKTYDMRSYEPPEGLRLVVGKRL